MAKEYKEVVAQDFLTFSRDGNTHTEIENRIIKIGGGGVKGSKYKKEVLKNAGWKYKDLTSYGAHAEVAAMAFNNIRSVISDSESPEDILEKLLTMAADND